MSGTSDKAALGTRHLLGKRRSVNEVCFESVGSTALALKLQLHMHLHYPPEDPQRLLQPVQSQLLIRSRHNIAHALHNDCAWLASASAFDIGKGHLKILKRHAMQRTAAPDIVPGATILRPF